jgi:hypothetical protein
MYYGTPEAEATVKNTRFYATFTFGLTGMLLILTSGFVPWFRKKFVLNVLSEKS